jgi:two-component system cell cycle response regulator
MLDSTKPSYSVEVIGFTPEDRALFTSTFALSARRERQFQRFDAKKGGEQPDLYLVDADNMSSMVELMTREPSPVRPAILVGRDAQGMDWPLVERPIKWTRLFAALDDSVDRAYAARLALARSDKSFVGTMVPEGREGRYDIDLGATTTNMGELQDAEDDFHGTMAFDELAALAATGPRMIGDRRIDVTEGVLVVDDDARDRQYVATRLLPFSLFVDPAENAEQAIAMLDHKQYLVVLIDIVMPAVDGFTLCKLIKARRGEDVPAVVLVNPRESSLDRMRAKMAGCDAYLTKPFDDDLLIATVAKFLPQTADDEWVTSQIMAP